MAKSLLDSSQLEAINIIEQVWFKYGALPTNERISETLGIDISLVGKWWNNNEFRLALVERGIDIRPQVSQDLLTPQQVKLANMLLNEHDKKSIRQKLEELKVTSQQYHAWLRQKAFKDYLIKRSEDLFAGSEWEGRQALMDTVRGGDIQAIKFYFELLGKYTPRMQVGFNIEGVLMQVVEVISKHVKEPLTLQLIANDIEKLLGNRPAQLVSGDTIEVP